MFNKKLEALATEQAKMSAELVTNGGSTTKDMVNKIAAIQWAELYEDKSAIIGYTDNKGNVTHINREFSRVTGRAADEFLGTNWVNVIHPKDRTRIIAEWTNAVKYDRDYEGEFSILDSNDREIRVESRAKKLNSSSGYYFKIIKLES